MLLQIARHYGQVVPYHKAISIMEFLTLSKDMSLIFQPPFHQILNPSNFFLYLKVESVSKSRYLQALEDIQKNLADILKDILVEAFQCCYKYWDKRLHPCLATQQTCFETDNIDFEEIKILTKKKSISLVFGHLVIPSKQKFVLVVLFGPSLTATIARKAPTAANVSTLSPTNQRPQLMPIILACGNLVDTID